MYAVTGAGGRTGRAEEVTPMRPELHLPAERLGPDTGEYYLPTDHQPTLHCHNALQLYTNDNFTSH